MIHAYFPGDKAIDRIKALGLGVALQPSFIRPWAETAIDFLGYDRAKGFTPSRSYIDSGIVTFNLYRAQCARRVYTFDQDGA